MSDNSRATETEKLALKAVVDGMKPCNDGMKYFMEVSGNWAGAALHQKSLARSRNNDLRLYRGEITWGEYNTARQDESAATSADIQSATERRRPAPEVSPAPVYVPAPAPEPRQQRCTTEFVGNSAYTNCR